MNVTQLSLITQANSCLLKPTAKCSVDSVSGPVCVLMPLTDCFRDKASEELLALTLKKVACTHYCFLCFYKLSQEKTLFSNKQLPGEEGKRLEALHGVSEGKMTIINE